MTDGAEPTSELIVEIEPLTAAAFAPFGEVIAHAGSERRHRIPQVFEHIAEAIEPSLWVSRVDLQAVLPIRVTTMEQHPFTAQTFIPLSGGRYLVVVSQADREDRPDIKTARAFLAGTGQGVTYRRGVWHHGLTLLDAPAEFAVLMHRTGRGDDDVFFELPHPFVVRSGELRAEGLRR